MIFYDLFNNLFYSVVFVIWVVNDFLSSFCLYTGRGDKKPHSHPSSGGRFSGLQHRGRTTMCGRLQVASLGYCFISLMVSQVSYGKSGMEANT